MNNVDIVTDDYFKMGSFTSTCSSCLVRNYCVCCVNTSIKLLVEEDSKILETLKKNDSNVLEALEEYKNTSATQSRLQQIKTIKLKIWRTSSNIRLPCFSQFRNLLHLSLEPLYDPYGSELVLDVDQLPSTLITLELGKIYSTTTPPQEFLDRLPTVCPKLKILGLPFSWLARCYIDITYLYYGLEFDYDKDKIYGCKNYNTNKYCFGCESRNAYCDVDIKLPKCHKISQMKYLEELRLFKCNILHFDKLRKIFSSILPFHNIVRVEGKEDYKSRIIRIKVNDKLKRKLCNYLNKYRMPIVLSELIYDYY